jgi:hypothetical protein
VSISMGVGMLDARAGTPGYGDVWKWDARVQGAGNGVRGLGVNAAARCVP